MKFRLSKCFSRTHLFQKWRNTSSFRLWFKAILKGIFYLRIFYFVSVTFPVFPLHCCICCLDSCLDFRCSISFSLSAFPSITLPSLLCYRLLDIGSIHLCNNIFRFIERYRPTESTPTVNHPFPLVLCRPTFSPTPDTSG